MKIIHIEARKKNAFLDTHELDNLSSPIYYIAYSIQYKELAEQVKLHLIKQGKKIVGFTQVLGCSELKSKYPILLVGTGEFHALNLALQDNEVYILPGLRKLDSQEIDKIKAREKGKYSKFLMSDEVGILVTSKYGQQNLKQAEKFKKNVNKKAYIFLSDNINLSELENFKISIFVNTACPGISYDSGKIINLSSIKKFKKAEKL